MTQRPLYLTDASSARLAALDVSVIGDRFEGTVEVGELPNELRQLFTDFEEAVEGHMFTLLDPIEERIRAAGLRVAWDGGPDTPVEDLQIFPSTGAISLRTTPPRDIGLNGQAAAAPLSKGAGLPG